MANLGQKDGIFHVRFRFLGREYKKSLKIRERVDAEAARNLVELTIHRLMTGQTSFPDNVDPGDFIVSGGTKIEPVLVPDPIVIPPTTNELIERYKESQTNLLAASYHYSQAMHLRHLVKHLDELADEPCDRVGYRDLDRFLTARLAVRHPNTAERERITLMQFYKWVVTQGHLSVSPAVGLSPIKGGADRPPFRTIAEVERIIKRGGLTDEEQLGLWECLYLSPMEIAGLLACVRRNTESDFSFLLHAIPAYTGMRRGEVLRLRWLDVELDEGFLMARSRKQSRRKSETVRRIDLHPELRKELIEWRQRRPKGQFVICDGRSLDPLSNDKANRCFWRPMNGTDWRLDKKRRWYKVGFHTYRHSFASNLAARGVDQRIIDEWMGHQTHGQRAL